MLILPWIQNKLTSGVDRAHKYWPRATPAKEKLRLSKIVAHRGEHDNRNILENSLAAFDQVIDHDVWGIELDVRWTRDLQPVVFHDPDCQRLFGSPSLINSVTLDDLRKTFPLIPTLQEVVQRYGKKLHLMIELKKEACPNPVAQNETLTNLLSELEAATDYHLISLHPDVFQVFDHTPRVSRLLVAEWNVDSISSFALTENYGGVAGHYHLLNQARLKKHQLQNQKVGTGFCSSKNCLFREINRGVDWIFTNDALKLRWICNELSR